MTLSTDSYYQGMPPELRLTTQNILDALPTDGLGSLIAAMTIGLVEQATSPRDLSSLMELTIASMELAIPMLYASKVLHAGL